MTGVAQRRIRLAGVLLTGIALAGCGPAAAPVRVMLPDPPPEAAEAAACERLVAALPAELDDREQRETQPRSPLVRAWGEEPVVLTCGVERPEGYRPPAVSPYGVNGVQWYHHIAGDTIEWYPVDRTVYLRLDVPRDVEAASLLVALAEPIKRTLPARPDDLR